MNTQQLRWVSALLFCLVLPVLTACQRGQGGTGMSRLMRLDQLSPEQQQRMKLNNDREAILKMAGTFKVEFDFKEALSLREGYELHKPYHSEAEELVVVVEDRVDFISLQHLLVVRHEGEAHVIKHWREDWAYQGDVMARFQGKDTWKIGRLTEQAKHKAWVQTVYNADDSPRYSSVARWRHDGRGVSVWDGSQIARPVPLRESHLADQYSILLSENSLVVSDNGWLHLQRNKKLDAESKRADDMLSLELGVNRYTRIADEGFDKAHTYWKSTAPFWAVVREAWFDVIAKHDIIKPADRWKGDPMFSHLFGLADEYWQAEEVSDARERIDEVLNGFLLEAGE